MSELGPGFGAWIASRDPVDPEATDLVPVVRAGTTGHVPVSALASESAVPSPSSEPAGKAVLTDGDDGYELVELADVATSGDAADVAFDNTNELPGDPTNVQEAIDGQADFVATLASDVAGKADASDLAQLQPLLRTVRTSSASTVVVDAADLGARVVCTNDDATDVEVADDLPVGWWCEVTAGVDCVITVVGEDDMSVVAAPSAVTEDDWSTFTLLVIDTNVVHVTGRGVE